MSDWAPPGRFDGLRIVRPLGRGGMGAVYLAHDEALDRPTALKLISAEAPSQALRARFLVEARALARLQHPNVVGVYRFGEVDGRPYLAYEFVEGGSLAALGALPWPRVLQLGLQIARGLAASHERGVVHRDVKPANIMVGVDGSVKLLDFGLAVLGASGDRPAQALTLDGRVVGTPAYMAPERWLGEAPSPAADVWAWAMVCRQLLTGAHPLDGVAPGQIPRRLTLDELPPCGAEVPQAPPVLCSFFDRCLSRLPERRPPSGVEVRDALEAISALLLPGGADALGEGRIGLVVASFARIAPQADAFARRFYSRIFEADPALRPLFPADMAGQREKLVGALQLAVQSLRLPEVLQPLLRDLGRRHAGYGVEARHFAPIGAALMGALAEAEAAAWSPTLAQAWLATWQELSRAVLAGLAEARGGDTLGLLTEGGDAIRRGGAPTLPPPTPTPTPAPPRAAAAPTPARSAAPHGTPLPSPLTRFFGRGRELAELEEQVAEGVRLLTILGMGGAGKTRLALELARRLSGRSGGRPVIWVPLAEARDHDSALSLVLRALGQKDAQGEPLSVLLETLQARPALLFLDNLEDLADTLADSLGALLEQCPETSCVLTSQRPLHLMGELLYRLEPLPLPGEDASPAEIEGCDAVALLVDRIRLLRPAFRPDATHGPQLLALARRVDGIPLALELVAARVGKVQLASLIERLETDIGLIEDGARNRPGRQRSLTAALRWTTERLDPEVRALFLSLSVFPGAFDVEEIEAVLGHSVDPEALELLIEHSLVVPVVGVEGRYRLLSTVRAYATSLADPAAAAARQERLVAHISDLCSRWVDTHGFSEHPRLTARLEASWSTILAVIDLATPEQAAFILSRLPIYVLWTSRFADVLPRIERLFALDILPALSPEVRAALCRTGHRLNLVSGHPDRAEAWRLQLLATVSLPLSNRQRDGVDAELALAAMERGAYAEAGAAYARLRAGEHCRTDTRQGAVHTDSLSRVAFYAGDLAQARALALACAAQVHALGDPQLAEVNLRLRSAIAWEEGDPVELDGVVAQLRALRQAAGRPAWDESLRMIDAMRADLAQEADRAWELCLEAAASDGGNRRVRAANHGNLALFAYRRGDWARALAEAERGAALLRALGRPADLPRPLWIRVDCLFRLGQAGEADAVREAARATLAVEGHFALRVSAPVLHRLGWLPRLDPSPAAWRAALQAGLDAGA